MKKFLFVLLASCFGFLAQAQTAVQPTIKFTVNKHDFGKIPQGKPVEYEFVFTNVSDKPVVIENAMASCGCTTPTWPNQPIMKGKTGIIKAGFNAAAPGPFDKTITVKIKGVNIPVEIRIVGEVVAGSSK
jgi:hypothetical protein